MFHNPMVLHDLLQGQFYLFFRSNLQPCSSSHCDVHSIDAILSTQQKILARDQLAEACFSYVRISHFPKC
jgi:hypothetical protein